MSIQDGGNAFPCSALRPDGFTTMYADSEGMSLRDYFAAKAMQALLSCDKHMFRDVRELTDYAYAVADAMLAARSPL